MDNLKNYLDKSFKICYNINIEKGKENLTSLARESLSVGSHETAQQIKNKNSC